MVELFRVHRTDDANVINHRRQPRQQLADPLAAFTVTLVLEHRSQHLGRAFDEGESFAFQVFLGALLPVEFFQRRLVLKQLQLRRRTRHVQVNNRFRCGWNPIFGIGSMPVACHHRLQRDRTEAESGLSKEMTAGDSLGTLQWNG